jgi:hypothetical protein
MYIYTSIVWNLSPIVLLVVKIVTVDPYNLEIIE